MLSILIVEDEPLFAQTLKHLVELNPLYRVTAVAEDSAGALAAVEARTARSRARRSPARPWLDRLLGRGEAARSRRPLPVHHRQGARFPDAGPCASAAWSSRSAEEDLVRALSMAEDMHPRPRGPAAPPQPARQSAPLCRRGEAGAGANHRAAADSRPLHRTAQPQRPRRPGLAQAQRGLSRRPRISSSRT